MSILWRLLTHRAGNQELPDDLGPDPEPDEPDTPEPSVYLTDEDFARAAEALNIDEAIVRAVAYIESAGRGFLPAPDGRPSILYEAHIFHRETAGRHATARDTRGRALSVPRWDRTLYGAAGAWQHDGRLAPAANLNWVAAHRACSWGIFQILGQNHALVGFARIHDMVTAARHSAGSHLDMFVQLVLANRLDQPLRDRNFREFARRYNGPGFAANRYDIRLEEAWRRFANV